MAVNLRERAVKVIVGIVDGEEVLKEVDFDKCNLCDMFKLLDFSEGTYSHVVVTREFYNKVDSKCNPEDIAVAKRIIKKMRGEQLRINRRKNFEEE